MQYGRSKFRATLLTFVVSAILHEFALILTFRVIEVWFFAAMVLQGRRPPARRPTDQPLRRSTLTRAPATMSLAKRGGPAVPLIVVTRLIKRRRFGNTVMWFSLFLGQPLLEYAPLPR